MTNEENKTKELIARAKSRDQQAFADLYDSYYGYAYRAIGDIIIDQGEREDIVQEAFTRIFTKIQKGEDVQNFGGLIVTTAKNIAKDHIKAREAEKRPKEVLSSFGSTDSETDEENLELFDAEQSEVQKELERASEFYQTPEERFEEQEVSDIIQEILAELPDYQQEALSLFYLEGMKQKEIADLYGVSVDTVKSRINQGKKKVEAKVIEIEKKKGIKLHTFAPLPFFFFLLRQKTVAEAASAPAFTYSAGATASTVGTSKGFLGAMKRLFAKSIKIAGKEISTKAIAGVVAAVVGVGSLGALSSANQSLTPKRVVAYIEAERYQTLYNSLKHNFTGEYDNYLPSLFFDYYRDEKGGCMAWGMADGDIEHYQLHEGRFGYATFNCDLDYEDSFHYGGEYYTVYICDGDDVDQFKLEVVPDNHETLLYVNDSDPDFCVIITYHEEMDFSAEETQIDTTQETTEDSLEEPVRDPMVEAGLITEEESATAEEEPTTEEAVTEEATANTVLGGPYVGTWAWYLPSGECYIRIHINEDGTGSFELPYTYGHLHGNLVATDEKRNIFKCSAFIDDNGTHATDVTIRFTGEEGNVTAYYKEAGSTDGEMEYPVVRE